jgi:hypothetical protein
VFGRVQSTVLILVFLYVVAGLCIGFHVHLESQYQSLGQRVIVFIAKINIEVIAVHSFFNAAKIKSTTTINPIIM